MNAYAAAASEGREAAPHAELLELFEAQNRGTDGNTEIAATSLKVSVTKA